MLHPEAVDASVLELLKDLQSRKYLNGFCLAGGTALALYNGHRKSFDIDLFSDFSFETDRILENISNDYDFKVHFTAVNTVKGAIDDIKIDIISHRYKIIDTPVGEAGITILSEQDIIAMKLNAISTSGQRVKDFIDIYFLIEKYDLKTMLGFYKMKYNQDNDLLVLKSLIYFEDAELSEWPVMIMKPNLKWNDVKRKLRKVVLEYTESETGIRP